jgi:cytochrome P450
LTATFPFQTPPFLDNDPDADALLAEHGPVVAAKMGPLDVWLALSHRAVRQVLTDNRFSREAATRPGGPMWSPVTSNPLMILSMDGKRHARVRKLMGQAFSARMVEQLEPRIQAIVDSLLDDLSAPADLVDGLAVPLPTMVICELLGAPFSDHLDIRRWTRRIFSQTLSPEELQAAQNDLGGYIAGLVHEKRANPDDKLISAMVAANDEGDYLTEEELLVNLVVLLIGGQDTTVGQLGNSFVTLLRHPDQFHKLQDDPSLIGTAIEELLRYTRLMPAGESRVTTEPVVLEGVELGTDAVALPMINAANRDPDAYPDPHRFDITREGPAPHLAFAHGPHFCLGAPLARMEMRVAITSTIKRFPGLRLTMEPEELAYDTGHVMRALKALPVTW